MIIISKSKVIKLYPKKKKTSTLKLKLQLIILATFLLVISVVGYNLYIKIKCKDIDYAIKYYLTSKINSEDRLLNIKKKNILFQDENSYTLEITGMAKNPPHGSKLIKASFTKENNDIWELTHYE